jgi:hypothetical protein
MSAAHFITPRVKKAVREAFPSSADEALEVLARAPVQKGAAAESIALGLVRMAKGDLGRLNGSIAHFDPRDALYAFSGVDWDSGADGENRKNA